MTEFPTFLLTVMPILEVPSVRREMTRKLRAGNFSPSAPSAINSARFRNLSSLGKPLDTVRLFGGDSDGELFASFGTAPLDYKAAVFG